MGQCINNMNMLVKKYGTDVMIAETGYKVDDSAPELMEEGRRQLASLIRLCREYTSGRCQGVFYWEPTCRPKQYELGAFSGEGKPTSIMRAFTMANLKDVTTKDTSNGTSNGTLYMVNGTCSYAFLMKSTIHCPTSFVPYLAPPSTCISGVRTFWSSEASTALRISAPSSFRSKYS